MSREKYVLTYDELYILIVGSLCLQIGDENVTPMTTLMIKNFLREARKANITQKEVSVAVSKFYNQWTGAGSLLDVNGKVYDLKFKISEDGTHKEFYLEEVSSDEVFDEEDSVDIVRQFIIDNMDMSSYEIVKSLKSHYNDSLVIPSQASVAAIKANITRKK